MFKIFKSQRRIVWILVTLCLIYSCSKESKWPCSEGTAGEAEICEGTWSVDILDNGMLKPDAVEWEPSIAVSSSGDLAVIRIGGGLWLKPVGSDWLNEIDISSCSYDAPCSAGTKNCGGDPIIAWDEYTGRFITQAKCADSPSTADLYKDAAWGRVEKINGQWNWLGWQKAGDIGYDWANLGIGPEGSYWVTGFISTFTAEILESAEFLESVNFYSPDAGMTWFSGEYLPFMIRGYAPLDEHSTAGLGWVVDREAFLGVFTGAGDVTSILEIPDIFFRLEYDPATSSVRMLESREVAKTKIFPRVGLLALADCSSWPCSGKILPETHANSSRHPIVVSPYNNTLQFRFIFTRDEYADDGTVWSIGLWEAVSLDGGKRWIECKLDGGINGDKENPASWKDAHLAGMVRDPVTGRLHLFYNYRDGVDKKQEWLVYRTMEPGANTWSAPCKLPHIKDIDPVTGSGTGRDYEDISAYDDRVAIVFHTKPQRCKVGEDGCPKRVLGVLRNF